MKYHILSPSRCLDASLLCLRRFGRRTGSNPPLQANRPRSSEGEGRGYMADSIGTLKVLVVRGKRLVIRDFTSSDPYVVARVGNQTLKTKEVFDRDRFKADDKMGHAHLNLQPIASASRLRRALRLSSGVTNLRKVAPCSDNCLLAESCITYVDGEILLDVRLKLCDVESGELELKLRWIDNPHDAREAPGGD